MTTRRKCPVCRKHVTPTMYRNVMGHTDKAGRFCPMSYEPYDLVVRTAA